MINLHITAKYNWLKYFQCINSGFITKCANIMLRGSETHIKNEFNKKC